MKDEIDLCKENIKKRIIPDNDYLPFVSVKQTLLEMEPGDIVALPIAKTNTVRVMAGRIKRRYGKTYRCKQNRKEKTIEVCRFS